MVRLCFYYRRNNKYKNVVDELNIPHTTETIKDLASFLEKHSEQRVNLCIHDSNQFLEENMPNLLSSLDNRDNLFIRFYKAANKPINKALQEQMKQCGIPFFYSEIAGDWDVLNGLIQQGVSDVYVGNTLGFELDKVAALAKESGTKIRVFPNIAQSAWSGSDDITKFFIRPEDLILYSKYVDCFEFYELNNNALTNTELLYEIYKYDKCWKGDLEAIIMFFRETLDNKTLNEQWGYSRIKCGKKCAKGNACRICYRLAELSNKMSEKELMKDRFLSKKLY